LEEISDAEQAGIAAMTDYILAIDNGTQSVRAILFDKSGEIFAKERVEFPPYESEKPGWAEQDPEVYWNALGLACRNLWEHGASPHSVKAVAVTTQRSTVVNVDRDGRPLRPAIVWLDQRRTDEVPPMSGLYGLVFRALGASDLIRSFQLETEANWIAHYQPEIWSKTDRYLLLSGFLNFRLTGEFTDSTGSQVGYLPFDYKNHSWAHQSDFKWKLAPFDAAKLPKLVKPGERIGAITKSASGHTGIPVDLPVIAAAADKACEVLGCGVLDSSIACLSYGTTATVNLTSQKYIEPRPLLPAYPAAVAGAYNLEEQIFRGFWMVSWFKQEFGQREESLSRDRNVPAETLFDDLLKEAPPGSMGLMLQPFWSPGVREPGPEAKGAIIGFGDVHRRSHLYRAIIEGLAYALRAGKEHLERRTATTITDLRIAGGGAQSDAVMQITADIFGTSVTRPHVYEASGLGAAINAAIGIGWYPSYSAAVAAMTRKGKTFTPDPVVHKMYDRLYHEVYGHMYRQLKPLYERIRAITGYPPPL
jgi:sugar (pentulose or hexulose) kinase